MAVRQSFAPEVVGYLPGATGSTSTSLNAATNWLAMSVIPKVTDKLYNLRAFITSITGSPVAANITCEIQTDNSGAPSGTDVTGYGAIGMTANPVAATYGTWDFTQGGANTGSLTNLTASTPYWAVFKNINGSPVANFAAFKNWTSQGILSQNFWSFGSASAFYGHACPTTTNSGTSWAANRTLFPNYRLNWSDGSYEGLPTTAQAVIGTVCNGTNEVGAKFTLPGASGLTYNIIGVMATVIRASTPAGFPQFKLYNGTTLVATTGNPATTNFANAVTVNYLILYFTSTQTLTGGTTVRITLSDTAADGGSVGYEIGTANTLDSDSNSASLAPIDATWQQTIWNGSSWADTATVLPFMGIVLDSTGEFTVASGSGPGGMMHPSIYWEV